MAGQTVTVSVLADTKRFSSGMKKVANDTGLSKLASAGKKAAKAVMIGVGAALAGATVITKKLIEAGERAGTANARIANITKSMGLFGDQADKVSGRVTKLADAIARQTGVDQNSIKVTAAKLMTFKHVAATADQVGGHFDRATKAAVDLAAAGFGTAETNAAQLGKALNDPIKGINALARSGVSFTEAEKAKIRALVESGELHKAQAIILDALETQVGGTAEATANATDRMKVAWSQAQEFLGQKLLPILDKVAAWFVDIVVPAIEDFGQRLATYLKPKLDALAEWFRNEGLPRLREFVEWVKREIVPRLREFGATVARVLLPRVRALVEWVTKKLIPGLRDAIAWVVRNKDWLGALAVAVVTVVAAMKAWQIALAAWRAAVLIATAVQGAWNAVMAANPIGLIVLALAGLVAGLTYFFTKTETGKKVWQALTKALKTGWDAIKGYFEAGWAVIKTALGKAWAFIKKVWGYSPLGLIVSNWDKIKRAFSAGVDKVREWLATAQAIIRKVWSYSPLSLITKNWDKITGFFRGLPTKLKSGLATVKDKITAPFKEAFNAVARLWNNTLGKVEFQVPSWVPKMGGKGWGFPKIPMLASGGILTRPTLFLGGEGGEPEAVLPLSKLEALLGMRAGRGDNIKIEINVEAGIGDPVEIGRQITHALNAYQRVNRGAFA